RLRWQTNLPSSALIFYGTTAATLSGWLAVPNTAAEHSVYITGLQPGAIYWVRVAAIRQNDTAYSETRPFATRSLSSGDIRVFFNQGIDEAAAGGLTPAGSSFSDVLTETLARINAAQQTIDVAMYNTSRNDLVTALKQAHNRGVRVRFIASSDTGNPALKPAPPFPVLYGNEDALMHNKFMVIDAGLADRCWVMGGSMNWTYSNMSTDYNNTLFIQDQSLARAYELEFNEMWGADQALPNPAIARFGSAKTDNTPHQFIIGDIPVECWFSPSDQVTQQIVRTIQSTDQRACFAIFSFTRNEVGNAFIDVHNGGAQVRGIMENLDDPGAEFNWLTTNGVPVLPHPAPPLMHHKYMVSDAGYPASDPLVLTGSHNWSTAAETVNDENTLVIHDPDIAMLFQAEFERRWKETTSTAAFSPEKTPFDVFPNPPLEYLYLRSALESTWSASVEIWNNTGSRCISMPLSGEPSGRVPLDHLPPGFYFLKIITQSGVTTVPFQKVSR
ncbi:MAG: phospholipase D-like domain-containing protein, partial [Thermoanaerobaculia bacterium]|nr:phospholipase D-like domain-containing protein [Thermoanaerobaculia bacterium]